MSKFTRLVDSPNREEIILAEITGINKSTGSPATFYFSSIDFTTQPSDTPANQYYDSRIDDSTIVSFKRSILSNGKLGGRATISKGELILTNEDNELDYLDNYTFDGQPIVIKMGGSDFDYTEFVTVLYSNCDTYNLEDTKLTFNLKDNLSLLEVPILTNKYLGTGGTEGNNALTGKSKPRCYGYFYNAEIIDLGIVNGMRLYQVNDGPVASYNSTYCILKDRGVPLQYDASDPPAAGKWTLRASTGFIVYNGTPAGLVTYDGLGDASGSGFVSTTADIIQRIVTSIVGLSYPGDFDSASFTALNSANGSESGIFVNEDTDCISVCTDLINSIGSFITATRDGLIKVGQIVLPTGTSKYTFTDDEILQFNKLKSALPAYRVTFGYKKNFRVMTVSDLSASFGANQVSNGDFGAIGTWVAGTGWTISSNIATATAGSASDLSQTITVIPNTEYALTFDYTRSAGTLQPKYDTTNLGSALSAASGSVTIYFTSGSSTTFSLKFSKDSSFAGTVDNVYIRARISDLLQNEYSTISEEDSAVKAIFSKARDITINSLLRDLADATTEKDRQVDILMTELKTYSIKVSFQPFQLDIADIITVQREAWGLSAGKKFLIVEIDEDVGNAEVELTLMG